MSKFLLITKINILQTFNLTGNQSKYKSERRKKGIKALGVIAIVAYIMWYIFKITKMLLPIFIAMSSPLYMIALLFVMCSLYILFVSVFRIKTILFDFKDYDLLMSLPVKRSSVITSKIIALYIVNLIYTLVVMIPGYAAYVSMINMPNDLIFFLLLFTIPIIPVLAASIIGIILTWLTSFFKNKNIGSYIINTATILIVLFISFNAGTLSSQEVANQSVNMINGFSKYYPLITLFVDIIKDVNFVNLLIYLLLPVGLMGIFIVIINLWYTKLRTRLLKQSVKSNYEIQGYKTNSPLKRLYLKELKKYFSNSMYVLNTAFSCILIIVLIIGMLVFNLDLLNGMQGAGDTIKNNIFMILSLACALSSTTNASISLEGKSLWIMKSIPATPGTIYLSKILVNLTILVPMVIIGATSFGIISHLPLTKFILLYLLPLAYSVFIAVLGLLLNLVFPKFDFDNEMRIIKQSLPVFLTMLIGMLAVILPFNLLGDNILLLTIIVALVDVALIITLHIYGGRKFKKL